MLFRPSLPWFDFRRLPFEDAFLKETSRSRSSSKRKQEEKVAKIAFANGSGSILGGCLLKMPV